MFHLVQKQDVPIRVINTLSCHPWSYSSLACNSNFMSSADYEALRQPLVSLWPSHVRVCYMIDCLWEYFCRIQYITYNVFITDWSCVLEMYPRPIPENILDKYWLRIALRWYWNYWLMLFWVNSVSSPHIACDLFWWSWVWTFLGWCFTLEVSEGIFTALHCILYRFNAYTYINTRICNSGLTNSVWKLSVQYLEWF